MLNQDGSLQTSIDVLVDTTLAGCTDGTVELRIGGALVGSQVIPADGVLSFDVNLTQASDLSLEATTIPLSMELVSQSVGEDISVDLESPQIAFTNRTDGDVFTEDDDDGVSDQQIVVVLANDAESETASDDENEKAMFKLAVSEVTPITARIMTLSIGGVQVVTRDVDEVASPIPNQTLVPGANVLTACVSDLVNPGELHDHHGQC